MSMETLTGTLKELGRRGDFYEYEVGGIKVATKKPDVAASVNSLIGQDVEMNAMKSQKTKDGVLYTNYYVVSAVPAEGAPPPQVGAGASPSSQQPAPTLPSEPAMAQWAAQPAPASPVASAALLVGPVEEREMRIMRQSAAKVAVQLLPFEHRGMDDLVARAEELVAYFVRGKL